VLIALLVIHTKGLYMATAHGGLDDAERRRKMSHSGRRVSEVVERGMQMEGSVR
jgi:hypothetical protein